MMRVLSVIGCLVITPAMAHDLHTHPVKPDKPVCHPYDILIKNAKAAIAEAKNGDQLAEFAGDQAKSLIETINAQPPVTDYTGDAVAAVLFEDGAANVIIAEKGCWRQTLQFNKQGWDDVVKKAIGDAS